MKKLCTVFMHYNQAKEATAAFIKAYPDCYVRTLIYGGEARIDVAREELEMPMGMDCNNLYKPA